MTDMDWADTIARNITTYHPKLAMSFIVESELATALRKAKADGVRSAVNLLKEAEHNLDKTKPGYLPNVGLLGNLEIIFGWEIEKIEDPSTPLNRTER